MIQPYVLLQNTLDIREQRLATAGAGASISDSMRSERQCREQEQQGWPAMVTMTLIGGALLVPGVAAAASNPSGNHGTVKVDARPFDAAPDNEPHVGCVFQVDFYGYDEAT
jgi:hypothetical protein